MINEGVAFSIEDFTGNDRLPNFFIFIFLSANRGINNKQPRSYKNEVVYM